MLYIAWANLHAPTPERFSRAADRGGAVVLGAAERGTQDVVTMAEAATYRW
jgi:hypothetical protein